MTKSTKILLIIAGSCVALSLLLALAAFAFGGLSAFESVHRSINTGFGTFDINIGDGQFNIGTSTATGLNNEYSSSGEYTISDDISAIQLDWVSGHIDFVVGGDSFTLAETAGESISEQHALRWGVKNGVLTVCFSSGTAFSVPSKDLVITIPEAAAAKLTAINCDVVSGDVKISDLSLQQLGTESVSGSLTLSNSHIVSADFDSMSGDMNVSDTEISQLSVDTTSGRIMLELNSCPSMIDIESVSGDAYITLPVGSGFALETDTVSGEVSLDFAAKMHDGEYIVGDGSGSFDFESVSGNLNMSEK